MANSTLELCDGSVAATLLVQPRIDRERRRFLQQTMHTQPQYRHIQLIYRVQVSVLSRYQQMFTCMVLVYLCAVLICAHAS